MRNKDTLFIYNQNKDLVTFLEYNDKEVKSLYKLEGRRLIKKFTNIYDEEVEVKNSIIDYEEDVTLQHLYLLGESCINATIPNSNHIKKAKVENRVQSFNGSLELFKVKPELMKNWLSILNIS